MRKPKKKILVIDDDIIHLTMAEAMLKKKYDVSTSKSGVEALDFMIKGYIPDLILLDIIMPKMDGWEIYTKIKGIGLLQNIPIIFITSLEDPLNDKHAKKLGITDFLIKPIDRKMLLNKVAQFIK